MFQILLFILLSIPLHTLHSMKSLIIFLCHVSNHAAILLHNSFRLNSNMNRNLPLNHSLNFLHSAHLKKKCIYHYRGKYHYPSALYIHPHLNRNKLQIHFFSLLLDFLYILIYPYKFLFKFLHANNNLNFF